MSRYIAILIICFQLIFPTHLMAQENQNNETLERPTCQKSTKNSIVSQLSLVAAATLGARFPFVCSHGFKTPSILAYSSGAFIYILSEVIASAKVKKDSNQIVNNFESQNNQAQKDAIEAQNEIDKANLKAIRTRLAGEKIMKIAGSIGTALAAVEFALETNLLTASWAKPLFNGSCVKDGKSLKEANSVSEDSTVAPDGATDVTDEAAAKTETQVADAQETIDDVDQPSGDQNVSNPDEDVIIVTGTKVPGAGGLSKPEIDTNSNGFSIGKLFQGLIKGKGLLKNSLCIVLGLSSFTKGGSGTTTAMCGLASLAITHLDKPFNNLASKTLPRAGLMALSTGITLLGSKSTKKAKNCLEDHIAYNEQLIERLDSSNNGITTIAGVTPTRINNQTLTAQNPATAGNFAFDPSLAEFVPREAGQINIPPIQLPQGIQSNLLEASSNRLSSLTDNLRNGRIAQANSDAAFLNNNAARIQRLSDRLTQQTNEKRTAAGLAPIDFDSLTQRRIANIQKGLGGAFDRQASSGNLAAASPIKINSKNNKDDEPSKFNSLSNKTPVNSKSASANAADLGLNLNDDSFFGGDDSSDLLSQVGKDVGGDNLNNYILNENKDINQSQTGSIFNILSVRYRNSAFDKLLERKK